MYSTDTLGALSSISISNTAPFLYESRPIELDDNFHNQLKAVWASEVGGGTSCPPLPNLRVSLPIEITDTQLLPPEDLGLDAIRDRKSIARSRWIDETIRKGDKAAYKNTYGAGSTISRNRKQLIDLELAHEFSFYVCYMTAEVVQVPRELDADHVCTWSTIKNNIWKLIDAMNEHPIFGEAVYAGLQSDELSSSFIYKEMDEDGKNHYFPTKTFYKVYFNDVSNLILAKKVENEDKPDSYFERKKGLQLYGDFLGEVGINTDSIIHRSLDGRGLGEAMRHRFFQLNNDIVCLFNSNMNVTQNLNTNVRNLLALRQDRQLTGGNISGRMKAESGRSKVMIAASATPISSDDSDSFAWNNICQVCKNC
jgi:hypothetical protein